MVISRELSIEDKSPQRNGSRNYFSEANYIEFSGVKVFEIFWITYIVLASFLYPIFLKVLSSRLLPLLVMFWWRI